ncbi:unnamed protein product [Schistosoma turkestanicum]|nr:unnamed protein product [Schistosoma turkestanicum]
MSKNYLTPPSTSSSSSSLSPVCHRHRSTSNQSCQHTRHPMNATLSPMKETYNCELMHSNCHSLITSKPISSQSQHRYGLSCYSKQQQSQPQSQTPHDVLLFNSQHLPRTMLSSQIQRPININNSPKQSYSPSKYEQESFDDHRGNYSYSIINTNNNDNNNSNINYYKSNIRQHSPYNHHLHYTRPTIKRMPETVLPVNRLSNSTIYHQQPRSQLTPCLSTEQQLQQQHQLKPSSTGSRNTNQLVQYPQQRTPSPLKYTTFDHHNNDNNYINDDEPDIWNVGSSTRRLFDHQPIYLTNSNKLKQQNKLLNKSKHSILQLDNFNTPFSTDCCTTGSLLSTTDEETVSLNTIIDNEENMNLLFGHSNSLKPLNVITKPEMYASTNTLVPQSIDKSFQLHHDIYPFYSLQKKTQQTNLMHKHVMTSDCKIKSNQSFNIQSNNIKNSINSTQPLPCTTTITTNPIPLSLHDDQPTTFIKTYDDDYGDQWTVYYRNPVLPTVPNESPLADDRKHSTILDLSMPKPLNSSCNHDHDHHQHHQLSTTYPRSIPEQQQHQQHLKLLNETKPDENTTIVRKKKLKKRQHQHHQHQQQSLSFKQTEYLIETLESLTNSIERNNFNLEFELKQMDHILSGNYKRSLYNTQINNNDLNSCRNSLLTTGRLHSSMCLNTRHNIGNRYEHKRKLVSLKHSDEFFSQQNRIEKVAVEVRVVFLKIGEIDTLKELYYADAFLQAKWREPKLDGHTAEELSITELEQYWNPLLYIDNILNETKDTQWIMAIRSENGEVYLMERRRIKGVFLETLELNDFPLDVQVSFSD